MKLYRLTHYDIAYRLRDQPEAGFVLSEAGPYFTAFDSLAAAVLESHIYRESHSVPPTMRLVEYEFPDSSPILTNPDKLFTPTDLYSSGALSESAHLFLLSGTTLAATFRSSYWRDLLIFLINPRSPDFKDLSITRVSPCS